MTADTDRQPIESPGDLIREIVRAYYGGRDVGLAKDAGVNRATVGRWISEERAISAIELFRVVAVVTSGHQEREAQVSAWLLELAGFEGLRVERTEEDATPRDWHREVVDGMAVETDLTRAVLDEDLDAFDAAAEKAVEELRQRIAAGRQKITGSAEGALRMVRS